MVRLVRSAVTADGPTVHDREGHKMADETINTTSTTTTAPVQPVDPLTTTTGTQAISPGGIGAGTTTPPSPHTEEAKSRFNAALEEVKAGATALKDEAVTRAGSYRDQARDRGQDLSVDARTKAGELAVEAKAKASGALIGLSQLIDENAARIDENFGPQYGDYARNASRQLRESAGTLERKSVDELGEDARSFVRQQPGTAVGIAAAVGYVFARLFRK